MSISSAMKHGTLEKWFGNGASLAVILANLWLKQYETALSRDTPETFMPEKILMEYVPSARRMSRRGEKVCCLNWYHVKCGDISDDEYQNLGETVWYCR